MFAMPWYESDALKQRTKFVLEASDGLRSISALCRQYGVSRKTAHKWLNRYKAEGLKGLYERSRAHHHYPGELQSGYVVERLLETKHSFINWGPIKIRDFLIREEPQTKWPAASTIGELFKRHGLVKPRRRRRYKSLSTGLSDSQAPNDIWSVDFKGHFKVGSKYIYPLTVSDHYSRFLLGCQGLQGTKAEPTMKQFERWFDMYGLPKVILSDNGTPFSQPSRTGLTQLSIMWVRLGIRLERIQPGHPEQNGRHERMHRTLKQDTALHPSTNFKDQQRQFDDFMYEYNQIRPHQALNGDVPAKHYSPSSRARPRKIPKPNYPDHFILRRVRRSGEIQIAGKFYYISQALHREDLGLEVLNESVIRVYLYNQPLVEIDYKRKSFLNV